MIKLDDNVERERRSSEEGPVPGHESATGTGCRAPSAAEARGEDRNSGRKEVLKTWTL